MEDQTNKAPGNRLRYEKSPYLLQHADNPVDWYPWGDEAFAKASRENKPIFLSVGYSTCHWCHVMERESFEDETVAALMNETFVNIKVDREERPDIDKVYMMACQILTGRGGWPLTVIMTPDKRPFFAGTYLPKENRYGQMGMLDLAPTIRRLWRTRRDELLANAEEISAALKDMTAEAAGDQLGEADLAKAFQELRDRFDEKNGGFASAPKFPTPHNFLFLLRYFRRTGDEQALRMVEKTLQAMQRGGLFDHVGFGFHRYSTDEAWLLPHFEKMLYDQAMLAMAYSEAFQATANNRYRQTAEAVFAYVLRDLTAPAGGFYSGEDADSEGVEGKFYLWREKEIQEVLGEADAALAKRFFCVETPGNYHDEATGRPTGMNILHLGKPLAAQAADPASDQELGGRLEAIRAKLFAARQQRVRPLKDDKILTDWNGLMIAALAKAGQIFDNPAYTAAAGRAADFLLTQMRPAGDGLLHRYREGHRAIEAYLDDYAFLIWGLIELYESVFAEHYLAAALALNEELFELFWDDEAGGFFFTSIKGEELLVRRKEIYDGAIPSGNSVAMLNLLRLGRMTGQARLEERAVLISRAFAGEVRAMPSAYTQLLAAVEFGGGPSQEIVIAGEPAGDDTRAMLQALRQLYLPNKVVILHPAGSKGAAIGRLAEFVGACTSLNGRATAYVCTNRECSLPTTDRQVMLELLTNTVS